MRFQIATEIRPIHYKALTRVEAEFTEFINMNTKCVKCVFGANEYASVKSAYNSLHKASKKIGLPVAVARRKNEIYLMRTDM